MLSAFFHLVCRMLIGAEVGTLVFAYGWLLQPATVRYGFPPESYAALTKSKKVRAMLAEAALDVSSGQLLAREASGY